MGSAKTEQGKAIETTHKIAAEGMHTRLKATREIFNLREQRAMANKGTPKTEGIHTRLKATREMLKLSQRAMAKRLGISFRGWQHYEYGITPPGGKVLAALAQEGFNAMWVLTGEEPVRLTGGRAEGHRDFIAANLLGDEEAALRLKIKTEMSMARYRSVQEGLEAAQNTVGYQPPAILKEAVRVLMFSYGLDREGAVVLLDFMKLQAEIDKAGGED